MSVFKTLFSNPKSSLAYYNTPKGKPLNRNNVRRIGVRDVPRMTSLRNSITDKLFGDADIYDIVYNSCLSLGIEDEGRLIGVVCLNDYPNIKSLPSWSWDGWMKTTFGVDTMTTVNSKWIQLLLFDMSYMTNFLTPILETLFLDHRKISIVALAIPPNIKATPFLTEYSSRIPPRDNFSLQTTTTVSLLLKKDFFRNYRIRKAVEEDNDDIVSIIHRYSSTFKELYGEYFISELLTRVEGTNRHVIVAEYNGYAVAVMILNKTVNYDVLNESFEVGVFHSFKTPHAEDEYTLPAETFRPAYAFFEESSMEIVPFDKASIASSEEEEEDGYVPSRSESGSIGKFYSSSESSSEESWTIDPSIDLSLMLVHREDSVFDFNDYFTVESHASLLSTRLLNTDDYARPSQQKGRLSTCSSSSEIKPVVQEKLKKTMPLPGFFGRDDAFALEVLVSHPDHESSKEVLLGAAFECFPKRNYCVMCVPSIEHPTDFLKEFVRVTPRSMSTFPHELFVRHRNSMDCAMNVRISIAGDKPFVREFLEQMLKPGDVLRQYEHSLRDEESRYISLIMTCERQVVGLAIVSQKVNMDYLYAHFTLYKWTDEMKHNSDTVAMLENFLIYPVFQKYCRYFLNEILRLADFTLLVYLVSPEDLDGCMKDYPLLNCLQYLVPVAPRLMPVYDPAFSDEACLPPPFVSEPGEVLSLFIASTRLSGVKRVEINTRIVVVGSGDTALSFLETLVFGSDPDLLVTFNNITVVSPHGLPFYKEVSKGRNLFQINRGSTVYKLILNMNLRIYVNTVHGVVNRIRRQKKIVIVNEVTSLCYDYLVLFCGEQYRVPKLEFKARKKLSDFPDNAFMINTDNDIVQVFNRIRKQKREFMDWRRMGDERIVIYGKDMRAIACLGALIEYGIPTSLLVLVEPTAIQNINSESMKASNLHFPDPEISEAIDRLIMKLGVKLYRGYKLRDWETNEEDKITHIEINSKSTSVRLRCRFLFLYAEKSISNKTYQAIYKAGLVFDGKLIIDCNFRTNDPFIFAAGTLTQYSKKYHAEHMSHRYYNAHEVGETIGRQFRTMLIPESLRKFERGDKSRQVTKQIGVLPHFHEPIVEHCLLPGGVFYLNIKAPGRQVPVEIEMTSDDYIILRVNFSLPETSNIWNARDISDCTSIV
ncbi:cilia- and flagella-associated protein 61-like isoform X3 [Harmonia axyridis]|uniref:cilia- and flagella-associated protein 61-like isoform X3 n=1 Tax=Harmonia axyridis TaxID=115357 RepID=UPI001E275121|nr:cilia- and flagella-associated protein 61-like isoform X3 [Harmonia axyridis]